MSTVALTRAAARPALMLHGYRFELVKLLSQGRVRALLLACWIVPGHSSGWSAARVRCPSTLCFSAG